MTLDIKLTIILLVVFMLVLFLAIIVVMNSIGNISHSLDRLQEIIKKEVILSYNQRISDLRQDKQREIARQEKKKRQEALLNVPLVKKTGEDEDEGE